MIKNETVDKVKSLLSLRQQAYQQVFNPENLFVEKVLNDLARFCRANDTTFDIDPRMHAALEGRREVYLRIMAHLKNNVEDLYEIYGGVRK